MLEREEVSRNLHNATVVSGSGMDMWLPPETIAELCRVYLAWLDARAVQLTECNQIAGATDFDYGDMTAAICPMKPGQRVRIVPEEPQP